MDKTPLFPTRLLHVHVRDGERNGRPADGGPGPVHGVRPGEAGLPAGHGPRVHVRQGVQRQHAGARTARTTTSSGGRARSGSPPGMHYIYLEASELSPASRLTPLCFCQPHHFLLRSGK
jgi:hypothetical protein